MPSTRDIRRRIKSVKNTAQITKAMQMVASAKMRKETTIYVAAGRKAAQFIARTKRNLAAEFTYKDNPAFAEARAISKFAQELFVSGKADRVDILFSNFVNVMTQKPETRSFLP